MHHWFDFNSSLTPFIIIEELCRIALKRHLFVNLDYTVYMKTSTLSPILLFICVLVGSIIWFGFLRTTEELVLPIQNETATTTQPQSILTFEDCVQAGYLVVENVRRQCSTPDGRTFAEEVQEKITYTNASADDIVVELPFPGAVTGKEFTVVGKARGPWFFEASFPVGVFTQGGVLIASGVAQAEGEWMTENFVPFKVTITIPQNFIGEAVLVLRKDNPSGLPENDASISFPITIEY